MAKKDSNKLTMALAVELAGIPGVDTSKATVYTSCPFCESSGKHKRGKKPMRYSFAPTSGYPDGSFCCYYCDTAGGPMTFWMNFFGFSDPKEAAKDFHSRIEGTGKNEGKPKPTKKEKIYIKKDLDLAPIDVRDKTYRELLNILTLEDEHKKNLISRGLTEKNITAFSYRSVPTFRTELIAKQLLDKGNILEGVPGFYKDDDGKWTLVQSSSGIMIPQRNGKDQIQGFQIRFDEAKDGAPRYITLSSRDRDSGAAATTPVHFRAGEKGLKDVILTEGALKADVISALSGYSVISIPGVSCQTHLPRALTDLKNAGLGKISIAFDMDIKTNAKVQRAEDKLKTLLTSLQIPFTTIEWDEAQGKGLDDYLAARKKA